MATNPYLEASNPYLNSQIDAAQGDIMRNWNTSAQPAFNSAMVKSGSFGNAGVNEMNRNASQDTQNALGRVSDSMRSQAYNQGIQNWQYQNTSDQQNNQFTKNFDQNQIQYWANLNQTQDQFGKTLANNQDQFGRTLSNNQDQFGRTLNQNQGQFNDNFGRSVYNDAYSQNMNNLTTGVGLLGTLAGYNANDLTNANNIQNTPLNYWSNFSNQANGMGQGYGSTTGTVGSTSNPLMSALGGAQLGSSAMGWWNNQGRATGGAPADASGYALSNYGAGGSAAGVTPYL
jgi:hypothetical protein